VTTFYRSIKYEKDYNGFEGRGEAKNAHPLILDGFRESVLLENK
jgi:hypothetical protein